MAKITASLVLVVLVMAFVLNCCSVDGAGRGNELEKNGVGIHNSQKLWWLLDCLFLYKKCAIDDFKNCPNYYNRCLASKHQHR
ncbi:unnamed protein product [Trifolium pratense]|uniref:Uncharacterized protein n=1 Tax=Trifolium pratense TaxID=57577 RepID=A0ACB0JEI4_TRIPR|nr:unnamed protein product [Trifolium pratense]